MKHIFKKMPLSYKILTIIILLCASILSFLFLPKPLAIIVLIYAAYKIIQKIKQKKYLKCIPYIFLLLVGFVIMDWGIYSSKHMSSSNQQVEQEDDEEADESIDEEEVIEATEDNEDQAEASDNETDSSDDESDSTKEEDGNDDLVNSSDSEKSQEDVKHLPSYTVESIDDTSVGIAVRKTLNIVVTEDYTLDDLYEIAKKEIKSYTSSHKISAIVAGFFTSADHIGKGYDMGRVEYVPNGNFSDAMNVTPGDYSSFKFVNYLEKEPLFPQGEELSEGTSDLDQIKHDFEETYDDCKVTVSFADGVLYIKSIEAEDQFFPADENAISCYTDWSLDNMKNDIKYLDITIVRPSSSVSALLDMSKMETDFGRYFDTFYIADNLI